MQQLNILGFVIPQWIYLPGIYVGWVATLLLAKRIIFACIKKFAHKTLNKLDDILLSALDFPLILLIFTSGGLVIDRIIPMSEEKQLPYYFMMIFKGSTIVSIIIFVDQFLSKLIASYSDKIEVLKTSGGIVHWFLRAVIVSMGILVLLDTFGISIMPVLASLGIGSLSVALALQPTLENFFSGIHLLTDKPIQVGQFIRLESGEEGYVYRIGWRSTWIRMPQNNVIVIPNKNLVNSKVINYSYPQRDCAMTVELGVHNNSDLEQVERVVLEVGEEVMKDVPGGFKDFTPVVRFHTFGEFSINLTVVMWVKEQAEISLIKHEFIKRLVKAFEKEGIIIPYPIRAINYRQESDTLPPADSFESRRGGGTNI